MSRVQFFIGGEDISASIVEGTIQLPDRTSHFKRNEKGELHVVERTPLLGNRFVPEFKKER